jgi:hypothetical protein
MVITLERDDSLIYIDEVNTTLLNENFDLEVFEVESDSLSVHASGSLYFVGIPVNGNTLTIHNNNATEVFLFKTTLTAPAVANEVEIGTDVAATVTNLATVINTYLSSLYVSATNEADYLYVTNQYGGNKGNLPRASFSVTGTAVTSIRAWASSSSGVVQFKGGIDKKESLRRLQFAQDIPQVVDGMMVSARKPTNTDYVITTSSVEYYFDLFIDQNVNQTIACQGAEVYNKQSYYVDLDFDCTNVSDDGKVLYDIYGPVTEPTICLD